MSENQLPRDFTELERTIGYRFTESDYIETALCHSSYTNEMRAKNVELQCNERMEFLGDSVLSIVTSEYLFTAHPDLPEGELSRVRSAVVCEKALGKFATDIRLGDYLKLGHGEELNKGRERISIIADAFEALLAAIYLDGGLETVKRFLLPRVTVEADALIESGRSRDYKTSLQQIVQQERGELLEYVTVDESGPMHLRSFTVEARLNSNVIGHGTAHSKREAEQLAAKEALTLFGENDG